MTRSTFKSATALLTAAAAPLALATAVHAGSVESATKVYPDAEVNVTKDAFSATKKVEGALDANVSDNGSDTALPMATTEVLLSTIGEPLLTSDGEKLGTVTNIAMDARGNPEMTVDVSEYGVLEGDELVFSMEADDIQIVDGAVKLLISADQLSVKAAEAIKGKIII